MQELAFRVCGHQLLINRLRYGVVLVDTVLELDFERAAGRLIANRQHRRRHNWFAIHALNLLWGEWCPQYTQYTQYCPRGALRSPRRDNTLEAFEKAVEADPNDGYTRRNLGGMLIGFKRIADAVAHLRHALALMPDDPQAIFGLATALEEVGTSQADEEADALYLRFIEEHPTSPMVEQAEKARTAFAQKRLRSSSVGGFRPDVTMYIAGALQTFKKLGAQKRQVIALEIAVLGRSGLDINDPEDKYTLKALPGKFSGLHLLAIMYTAFRQIDPTMDTGADFGAEYQAALQMQ